MGGDEMAGSPEGVIVGQAFLGASVRLLLGHLAYLSLNKIDQADVLHKPSPSRLPGARSPHSRSGKGQIDSAGARGYHAGRGPPRDESLTPCCPPERCRKGAGRGNVNSVVLPSLNERRISHGDQWPNLHAP